MALLTKNIRQNNNSRFHTLLSNVRTSSCTNEDIQSIMKRELQHSANEFLLKYQNINDIFCDTQVVAGTKVMTRTCNEFIQCMSSINCEDAIICKIPSVHNSKLEDNKLEENNLLLYLKRGDKIILTSNLCTNRGVVNSTLGTIKYIVYDSFNSINTFCQPSGIIIEMINNSIYSEYYRNSLLLIKPTQQYVDIKSLDIEISQKTSIPLALAHCLTIHKTQSLTLDRLLVLMDDSTFAKGLYYTAFSRVREAENLFCMSTLNLEKSKQLIGKVSPAVLNEIYYFMRYNILDK